MSENAILGYLDLVWRARNESNRSFLDQTKSFDAPLSSGVLTSSDALTPSDALRPSPNTPLGLDFGSDPTLPILPILPIARQTPSRLHVYSRSFSDGGFNNSPVEIGSSADRSSPDAATSPPVDLPIHTILLDIYKAAKDNDAEFFEPFVLHYWQLQRLLDGLRCNTPILRLPSLQRANDTKILDLRSAYDSEVSLEKKAGLEIALHKLEAENSKIAADLAQAKQDLEQGLAAKDKDNIQAVLVLSTLLNIVFRDGMSVPLLSDQLRLEAQQKECQDLLLLHCDIGFDERFKDLFSRHSTVQTGGSVGERITTEFRYGLAWMFDDDSFFPLGPADRNLAQTKHYAARVLGTQLFHGFYNHVRLGGTRFRRLLAFLEPYLQSPAYTAVFKTMDPYLRWVLSYTNFLFFVPRLSLHFSILYHHVFDTERLELLECNLDPWVRFRAHWTRFAFEVFTDGYWFLNGLKFCFWLPGGALSPVGIYLSLTVQALDLLNSILRAIVELNRLSTMCAELEKLDPNLALKPDLDKRYWFEAMVLGYMICHFSILLISLCLTLPSMAAVSTMWPVVGGVCSVAITYLTYRMQLYFNQHRQAEFEPQPKALPENDSDLLRSPSLRRIGSTTYA
jgi:hypothetical protein